MGKSAKDCATLALAFSAMIAACSGSANVASPQAAEKILTSLGAIKLHRHIAAWYRLCPEGFVGSESAVVIWPAVVEMEVDLQSARITDEGTGRWRAVFNAPRIINTVVPVGFSDSMLSPVQLALRKQEDSAIDHLGRLAELPEYLARQYFLREDDLILDELRQVVANALSPTQMRAKRIELEFRKSLAATGPIPQFDLCPGSVVVVNGIPLLQSQNGENVLLPAHTRLPLLVHTPHHRSDSTDSQRPPGHKTGPAFIQNIVGTTYLLPNFTPLTEPRTLGKIAGGTKAAIGEFPFAVALAIEEQKGVYIQYCGGSLIAKDIVLTAAHCEVALGDVAIIGAVDLDDLKQPGIEVIPIKPYETPHNATGYGAAAKFDADLQLVPLKFASSAKVASVTTDSVSPGDQLVAIGWGLTQSGRRSSSLMRATLTVNSLDACKVFYSKDIHDDPYGWGITERMMCVGGGPAATCDGDSGGPLIAGAKIAATVSFGATCKDQNQAPTLFSRLTAYPTFLPK